MSARDRLGARRILFDVGSGAGAETLADLLARVPAARRGGLDPLGVRAAWSLGDAPDRTCLAAVRAVPPSRPRPCAFSAAALADGLRDATARALAGARRPIVALGGGLDAPLAVLAARRAGFVVEHAVHVSVPSTSYDESQAARETAAALSLSLHEVRTTVDELAAALPHAVRRAETPLYNLHPVSRMLAASAAAERGHDALLTGDGADQAARGVTEPADYVPVVAAITRHSGIALAAPFTDDALVDLVSAAGDPNKLALRALARAWRLPEAIADRRKVAAFAPRLPRSAFPGASTLARLAPLARGVGEPLRWSDDDRLNVGIASLSAFVAAFEIEAV